MKITIPRKKKGTAEEPFNIEIKYYNNDWNTGAQDILPLPSRKAPKTPKPVYVEQHQKVNNEPVNGTRWEELYYSAYDDNDTEVTWEKFAEKAKSQLSKYLENFVPIIKAAEGVGIISFKDRHESVFYPYQISDEGGNLSDKADPEKIKKQLEGWQRVDSYVSFYHFVVEGDEETGGLEGLLNDTFEITTEYSNQPFPLVKTEPAAEQDSEEVEKWKNEKGKPGEIHGKVVEWFKYYQTKTQAVEEGTGIPQGIKVPDEMDLDSFYKFAKSWLGEKIEGQEHTAHTKLHLQLQSYHDYLNPPNNAPEENNTAEEEDEGVKSNQDTFKLTIVRGENLELKLDHASQDDSNESIGNVIGVDIREIKNDDNNVGSNFVIRVAVLDEPYKYTRCRMKVIRNEVDFNNDKDFDFNPRFVMETPASQWMTYDLMPLDFTYKSNAFPDALSFVTIDASLADEKVLESLYTWYEENEEDEKEVNFGDGFDELFKKYAGVIKEGSDKENLPWWKYDELNGLYRTDPQNEELKYIVTRQVVRDVRPTYAQVDNNLQSTDDNTIIRTKEAYTDYLTTQFGANTQDAKNDPFKEIGSYGVKVTQLGMNPEVIIRIYTRTAFEKNSEPLILVTFKAIYKDQFN